MNHTITKEKLIGQMLLDRYAEGDMGDEHEGVLDEVATAVSRRAVRLLNQVRSRPDQISTARELIRYNINASRP